MAVHDVAIQLSRQLDEHAPADSTPQIDLQPFPIQLLLQSVMHSVLHPPTELHPVHALDDALSRHPPAHVSVQPVHPLVHPVLQPSPHSVMQVQVQLSLHDVLQDPKHVEIQNPEHTPEQSPIQFSVHPAEHPRPLPDLYPPIPLAALSIHPPKQDDEHALEHDMKHLPMHPESQHSVFLFG